VATIGIIVVGLCIPPSRMATGFGFRFRVASDRLIASRTMVGEA